MMPAAAVGTALAVGSAAVGAYSANQAGKTQKKAAKKAAKQQQKYYEQARKDLQPYSETGKSATYGLADMYGLARPGSEGGEAFSDSSLEAFRKSPDYQVAAREGVKALDHSAAAKGSLLSGGQLKGITEFGSDLASLRFGSYLDNLFRLSGMGERAATNLGSAAMTTGGQQAGFKLQQGQADAAGTVGVGNAISGGLDSLSQFAFSQGGGSAYGNPSGSYGDYYNDYGG